jgi:hypothetical protein
MNKNINDKIVFLDKVILFLVDRFQEIDIVTQKEEWQHMKSFQINDNSWEHKFYHPKLDYVDIKDIDEQIYFNIDVVHFLRKATLQNDLELVKKLFFQIMKQHNNPNIGYYEESETNLTNAARYSNLDIIKFLVENGVSIHNEYESNIRAALNSGRYDVAEYFLETDSKINIKLILDYESDKHIASFINSWILSKELEQGIVNNKEAKFKLKI